MSDNNYSFGTNQFYPNQGNYGNGNGNGGVLNSINNGFGYIYKNRWFYMFIVLSIPILTFMIIAFTKKGIQSELGWTCLLLILTICIFYYAYVIRNVPPNQFILLLILIIFEIGFIIYFLTKFNVNLNQNDYVNFYNDSTFSNRTATPMFIPFASNNQILNVITDGTQAAFAIKEDLPNDLGLEATYSFWMVVCPDNFMNTNKKWKTVWFRGDQYDITLYKNKSPGVYLEPTSNNLIITFACENGPEEGNAIIIEDIPLSELFCITIVINGRSLEVYKNGLLEKSISLTGNPIMKNTNIIKGLNGGFTGRLYLFRYDSSALIGSTIHSIYEKEKKAIDEYMNNNPLNINQIITC
jgi:hypothetical protein